MTSPLEKDARGKFRQSVAEALSDPEGGWDETEVHCADDVPLAVSYDWTSKQPGRSRCWHLSKESPQLVMDWRDGDYAVTLHDFKHDDRLQFETATFATSEEPYKAKVSFRQSGALLKDHISIESEHPELIVKIARLTP